MARRKNSELTPPPTGGFSWESRTITRLGLSAALVSASLGILFAVLQAQGWTVPKPLALVALLGVVIVVAATWFLFEVLRALRRLYEHLLTTPSWVESDPPGQLDFPVDGNRSLKRFTKELKRLTKPTKRLNRRIVIVTRLLAISANWDARIKRLVANLLRSTSCATACTSKNALSCSENSSAMFIETTRASSRSCPWTPMRRSKPRKDGVAHFAECTRARPTPYGLILDTEIASETWRTRICLARSVSPVRSSQMASTRSCSSFDNMRSARVNCCAFSISG